MGALDALIRAVVAGGRLPHAGGFVSERALDACATLTDRGGRDVAAARSVSVYTGDALVRPARVGVAVGGRRGGAVLVSRTLVWPRVAAPVWCAVERAVRACVRVRGSAVARGLGVSREVRIGRGVSYGVRIERAIAVAIAIAITVSAGALTALPSRAVLSAGLEANPTAAARAALGLARLAQGIVLEVISAGRVEYQGEERRE